jgi:hypothetical protein
MMEIERNLGDNDYDNSQDGNHFKRNGESKFHSNSSTLPVFRGSINEKNMGLFSRTIQQAATPEQQVELMKTLLKASQEVCDKFANYKGMKTITDLLDECAENMTGKFELIEKILIYLGKVTMTKEILTNTKVHRVVEKVKYNSEASEELSSKAFRLLIKWKQIIDDWTATGGEELADRRDKEMRERQQQRSFIKRTSYFDRNGGPNGLDKKRHYEDTSPRRGGKKDPNNFRFSKFDKKSYRQKRSESPPSTHYKSRNKFSDSRDSRDRKFGTRRRRHDYHSDDDTQRKTVKWLDDPKLLNIKYFRFTDEPTHPGLTEAEVEQIQKEAKDNSLFMNSEDYKHKESLMEGISMKMRKDTEKEIQDKLDSMSEKMRWESPKTLFLGPKPMVFSKQSMEKETHEQRIAKKLPCFYLKDFQIPDQPSYESVLNRIENNREPINIPLVSMSETEKVEEENQEFMQFLEIFGQKNNEIGLTNEANSNKEMKVETIKEDDKAKKREEKKPLKGILKKMTDDNDRDRSDRRKSKWSDKPEKESAIPVEMLVKLIQGEISSEDLTNLTSTTDNQELKDLTANVSILKGFMERISSQSSGKLKKTQKSMLSSVPSKKVKTNNDGGVVNLLDSPTENQAPAPFTGDAGNPASDSSTQPTAYSPGSPNSQYNSRDKGGNQHNKVPYRPPNYKTVPCRMFHSSVGCSRGEGCHFIHDLQYAGRETPNMHKYVRSLSQLNNTSKFKGQGDEEDSPPTPLSNNPPPQSVPTQSHNNIPTSHNVVGTHQMNYGHNHGNNHGSHHQNQTASMHYQGNSNMGNMNNMSSMGMHNYGNPQNGMMMGQTKPMYNPQRPPRAMNQYGGGNGGYHSNPPNMNRMGGGGGGGGNYHSNSRPMMNHGPPPMHPQQYHQPMHPQHNMVPPNQPAMYQQYQGQMHHNVGYGYNQGMGTNMMSGRQQMHNMGGMNYPPEYMRGGINPKSEKSLQEQ